MCNANLKTFAAHAPQYFPGGRFFYKMTQVDNFVLVDDLQFTTHGEGNRMRIKTHEGAMWLTVPVHTKGKAGQLIKEVRIDNALNWRAKHWKTLRCHYGRAAYLEKYADQLEKIFRQEWKWLVDLNLAAFELMHRALQMKSAWCRSSKWEITANGTERIVEMGRRLHAERYLTEQENAKFLQEEKFVEAKIALAFFTHTSREYHQQYGSSYRICPHWICCSMKERRRAIFWQGIRAFKKPKRRGFDVEPAAFQFI